MQPTGSTSSTTSSSARATKPRVGRGRSRVRTPQAHRTAPTGPWRTAPRSEPVRVLGPRGADLDVGDRLTVGCHLISGLRSCPNVVPRDVGRSRALAEVFATPTPKVRSGPLRRGGAACRCARRTPWSSSSRIGLQPVVRPSGQAVKDRAERSALRGQLVADLHRDGGVHRAMNETGNFQFA